MVHSCPIYHAFGSAQAPAVQLQEHAAALLADDADIGVKRGDSFVKALAKSDASHSVAQWQYPMLAFNTCEHLGDQYFNLANMLSNIWRLLFSMFLLRVEVNQGKGCVSGYGCCWFAGEAQSLGS